MVTDLIPAQVFCAGEFVDDELIERGWTVRELAERMGGDPEVNQLALGFLLLTPGEPGLMLGDDMAQGLERAFGPSAQFWLNLDAAWRRWPDRQTTFTPRSAFP